MVNLVFLYDQRNQGKRFKKENVSWGDTKIKIKNKKERQFREGIIYLVVFKRGQNSDGQRGEIKGHTQLIHYQMPITQISLVTQNGQSTKCHRIKLL